MTAPRLWLVRHARPLAAEGLCYGRLDLPAEAEASRSAAAALAQALPPQPALMQHSPLQRCELLAHDVQALRPDLPSNPEPRIAEMDFGTWEGRAWAEIARPEIDTWAADLAHQAPGGGEPLAAMLARVAQALQDAAARAQGGDVVWITHAGVARCVQWLLAYGMQRMPRAQEWTLAAPAFGAWMTLALPRPC